MFFLSMNECVPLRVQIVSQFAAAIVQHWSNKSVAGHSLETSCSLKLFKAERKGAISSGKLLSGDDVDGPISLTH